MLIIVFSTCHASLLTVLAQILADEWAKAGFATYMPDYLLGDYYPTDGSVSSSLPF